jgi:hypothetical protein
MTGRGQQREDLVVSMSRAAEAAVPLAKTLLIDAVKSMSVTDAKNILTGGDNSVTDFFRQKTVAPLAVKFLPIVKSVTDRSGLASKYNGAMSQIGKMGLVPQQQSSVEGLCHRPRPRRLVPDDRLGRKNHPPRPVLVWQQDHRQGIRQPEVSGPRPRRFSCHLPSRARGKIGGRRSMHGQYTCTHHPRSDNRIPPRLALFRSQAAGNPALNQSALIDG